jgi:UDP-GlcNAc:undecaprenyl-phosphate GlcNAc-1-phosphate transferase
MAKPVKERWHKTPTALLGGIAIYTAISLPLLFMVDFSSLLPHFGDSPQQVPPPSLETVLWLGVTLLFILGLLDDFIQIKPHTKLVGQILVASMVTFLGFRLQWVVSLTGDTILTIIWIVGITNAFNLLDNMDGLCTGTGIIASLFSAYLLWPISPTAAQAGLVLAGALIAFLIYNYQPASIFMGDCGSLPIGFTLAMLSLFYASKGAGNTLAAFAVPILLMLVPILDTTMVTLIRTLSGRKASTGGKDHTSHRLVLMGLSEKGAVLVLWGIGIISGISSIFVSRSDSFTSPSVIIPVAVSVLLMGIYLSQLHVYPEKEFSLLRNRTFTPVLVELTYKRQLLLVILDFCLVAFAYYLSYRLRFQSEEFVFYFKVFLRSLPAVIACKLVAYFIVGVYRGIWGYMSTNDVLVYLKGATFGTVLSVAAVTFVYRFEDFSKGIFVIDWLLASAALLGSRGFFRLSSDFMKRKTLSGKRAFIYGAGRGGEILLREILNNTDLQLSPIGFIDDDPLKNGKKLQGYAVMGTIADLAELHEQHRPDCVVISFNEKSGDHLKRVKQYCRENSLALKRFDIMVKDVDIG